MASATQWTWVLASSRNWWWTGRPGVLLFMGSQRGAQDWATELNWKALFKTMLVLYSRWQQRKAYGNFKAKWWWWSSCSVLSDSLWPHGAPPGSSVHGILQARTLEWVAISFSRGIFLTQELNPGLLHCRQILYQLSYVGLYNVQHCPLGKEKPVAFGDWPSGKDEVW